MRKRGMLQGHSSFPLNLRPLSTNAGVFQQCVYDAFNFRNTKSVVTVKLYRWKILIFNFKSYGKGFQWKETKY